MVDTIGCNLHTADAIQSRLGHVVDAQTKEFCMSKVSTPAHHAASKTATKFIAACAVLAAATVSFNAHAGGNVNWTVTVGSSFPVVVQPVPAYYPPVVVYQPPVVYTQPQVVYTQPQVVYAQPQVVYAQPRVVYAQPRVVYAPQQVVYVQPGHGRHHGYGHGYNRHHDNHGQRIVGATQVVYR
jgi:hypothetical protein